MKPPTLEVKVRTTGRMTVREDQLLRFKHQHVVDMDFSGRKVLQLAATGSKIERCRFDKVRAESCAFGTGKELSEYIDCSFDGLRFRHGNGGYSRFVRCHFRNVDLQEWFCYSTEFIDCTFSGRLRKAIFMGSVPEDERSFVRREHNEFRGNDFSAMTLEDVAFRNGIDLTLQRLPSGPKYLHVPDAEDAVRRARTAVITWRDLERRRDALVLINILDREVQNGQRQLFLCVDDYGKAFRATNEAVFALVRGP